MPNLIEDRPASLLAEWIDSNRPVGFPDSAAVPILVANRDELRTRPCVVLEAAESKRMPPLTTTARVKLNVHLFTQIDDTAEADHAAMAKALVDLLGDTAAIKSDLDSDTFLLQALIPRDSTTTPDEGRGRVSVISFDVVVAAV